MIYAIKYPIIIQENNMVLGEEVEKLWLLGENEEMGKMQKMERKGEWEWV